MGRKGMIELTYLILAIVFIIILTLFAHEFSIGTKEVKEVEACRFSVLKNSELRLGIIAKKGAGLPVPTPEISGIECPKRKLEISSSSVDQYPSEEFGAKYEIAEAMRKCWYQWGQNQLSPFDTGWFETGKRFCAICYDLSFDEGFSKDNNKIDNLIAFMSKENVPDGSSTFIKYLTNNNTNEIPQEFQGQFGDSIDSSKSNVIMYIIDKKGKILGSVLGGAGAIGGGAAGCKIGGVIGTFFGPGIITAVGCSVGFIAGGVGGYVIGVSGQDHDSYVRVAPTNILRDLNCDILYQ